MLKPVDVGVLLYLLRHPQDSFAHMSALLGISKSTAHVAVRRLEHAGLIHRHEGGGASVARDPALEFLQFGAPYAFKPTVIPRARGVLTGLAALGPSPGVDAPAGQRAVWPWRLGTELGVGVEPVVPAAPDLALRDDRLYRLLALFDALRIGDAREREYARSAMRTAFTRDA